MANLILPKRYTTEKPPLGSQIDWGHPLSKGLVGCWLMNEGGGAKIIDLTKKSSDAIISSASTTYYKNGDIYNNAGIANLKDVPILSNIPPEFTIVFSIKTSTDAKIFYQQQNNNPLLYLMVGTQGWGGAVANKISVGMRTNDGNYLRSGSSNKTITDNIPHQCVVQRLIRGINRIYIYVDGKYDNQFDPANYGEITCLGGGNHNFGSTSYVGYLQYFYYYPNRILSPSEIQQLYIAPYQMIAPRKRVFYSFPETTTTTPSIGIITKRYSTEKPPLEATLNYSHPLSRGLVGCWLMNEGGGLKIQQIGFLGFNKLSSFVGAVTWGLNKSGKVVESLTAAVNNYITLGVAPASIRNSCSIVMGYKKKDAINRTASALVSKTNLIEIYLPYADGTVYFDFGNATAGQGRVSVAGLSFGDDIWAFVADISKREIWQNGKLRVTGNANQVLSGNPTISLFSDPGVSSSDIAQYKFLYIFSRALSPQEVQSLYIAPYQMIAPRRQRFIIDVAGGEPEPPPTVTPYGYLSCNKGWW